jgi:hypothetical protein
MIIIFQPVLAEEPPPFPPPVDPDCRVKAEDWLSSRLAGIQTGFEAATKAAQEAYTAQEAKAREDLDSSIAKAWGKYSENVNQAVKKFDQDVEKATKDWETAMKIAGHNPLAQWMAWYTYEAAIAKAAAERDKSIADARTKLNDCIRKEQCQYDLWVADALQTMENAENKAIEDRAKQTAVAHEAFRKACMTCEIPKGA